MRRSLTSLFLTCFLLLPSGLLWAQASVNVSTLDPVYRDIDKLVGHGLVTKIIMGQRPFSRREIARITAEAMFHFKKLKEKQEDPELSDKERVKLQRRIAYIEVILKRMKRRFHEELIQLGAVKGETKWYSLHGLDHLDYDTTVTNSPPRGIPGNGLGFADNAIINPFLQYRQGRNLVDGANLAVETTSWLRATNHFAFLFKPRFQAGIGRDGMPDDTGVYILDLYAKFFIANFEVQAGRGSIFYGQGLNAGLLASNNPRGLDMVKLSNDSPGYLPWVFRYMGPQKLSFFFANLGPDQNFPYPYLVSYKWSLQPLSWFELGFGFAVQGGGDGSPPATFGERVLDAMPFAVETTLEISNKLAGFDFRFRIPPAQGSEIYGEWIFDDTDLSRFGSIITEDSGYVFGVYLPRVTNSGNIDLRLEYHRTGIRFYRHAQFTSGYTENQNIIGDNLGPDGHAGYLWLNWDINPQNLITFAGAFENRSNDIYAQLLDPFAFEKIQVLPKEMRYRGTATWLHRMEGLPLWFIFEAGYERVQNFDFVSGQNLNNFLGRLMIRLDLDRVTRSPRSYH